ncbi:MAG: EpsG family protein [Coriobacteriaceae bacterium]|nr:EpsG family protein [Coriobacteriaceae bacterium]
MLLISICAMIVFTVLLLGARNQRIVRDPEASGSEIRHVPDAWVLVLFVSILVIVSTLRFGFIDTYAYKIMYELSRDNLSYVYSKPWGVEEGWLLLLYFLNFFSSDSKLMLFIVALVVNVAFAKTTDRFSTDVVFSLLIYFCLSYLDTNNGLRQYFSAAIIILAYPLLLKRHYLLFVAIVLGVSTAFHQSAIVCLAVGFLALGKPLNKGVVVFFCVAVVLFLFPDLTQSLLGDILEDNKYGMYASNSNGAGLPRVLVTAIVPAFLGFLHIRKCRKKGIAISRSESFLLNIMFMSSCFSLLALNMAYWARLCFYTSFASCILMPKLIDTAFGDSRNKGIIRMAAIACYVFFFIYNIYVNADYGALDQFYVDAPVFGELFR